MFDFSGLESENIGSKKTTTCKKCKKSVSSTRSESWDVGLCPACFELDNRCDTSQKNELNVNPLLTKTIISNPNPVDLYLNRFTPMEIMRFEK